MAPKTRAKSVKAGAKDPNLTQTIKSKLYIYTREDDSKNTQRYGHSGASMRLRNGKPTVELELEDVELEVADFLVTEDFRSRWASASDDVLVAAATMVQMKKDPNYSAPVHKESRLNCNQTRRGCRS